MVGEGPKTQTRAVGLRELINKVVKVNARELANCLVDLAPGRVEQEDFPFLSLGHSLSNPKNCNLNFLHGGHFAKFCLEIFARELREVIKESFPRAMRPLGADTRCIYGF